MIKVSPIVKDNKKLIKMISDEIATHVFDFIFKDALEIVSTSYQDEFENALKSENIALILKEIKKGNISIDKSGNVKIKQKSVRISKALKELGSTWNIKKKIFKIDTKKYPDINQAQAVKNDQVKKNLERLDEYLITKEQDIQTKPMFVLPDEKVDVLIKDVIENVKIAIPERGQSFAIIKRVDSEVIKQFKDEYLKTTSLPINNMKQRAIERLRKKLLPLVMEEGYTQADLSQVIQSEFGMTKRRADFLARQETKLIKSKIIKDRAVNTGHTRYIWQTAGDQRVRDTHRALNGKIFDFNNPPIIDELGNRGNPGEDYNCYSYDTEVYTERGFALIKDVMQGEKVLTLNPETKDLEWATCINKFKKYEENILEFRNKSFLLKCSKDHTFFTYKYIEHTKGNYTIEPRFIHGFNNLGIKSNRFYCSSCWVGDDIKFINIGNQEIPIKDFCLLMGYYLSEGSVDNRDDRNAIKISQTKYLDEMYENLSFFNPRKGKEAIYIFNTDLKNYLKQFGYSYQKHVSNVIKQLPSEYIRIFLDAFCLGDGSPKKIIYSKRFDKNLTKYNSYYTSSKRLANDLVELIIKCGMSATLGIMKCKDKVVNFRNGTYKINYDVYIVRENVKKHRLLTSMNIREIPYNDYVYDIEVNKNHTLLIKTGNFIHWNSNCRCIARIVLTES